MNFLEKNLETIIWENYDACEQRGLAIDWSFFRGGLTFRQLQLPPYGIADLVNMRYDAVNKQYVVQVIELKRGKIDMLAYMQAKRYITALHVLLRRANRHEERTPFVFATVLIGSEVDKSGDFVFAFNYDLHCKAFTYAYDFDGIRFTDIGKEWRLTNDTSSTGNADLVEQLKMQRAQDEVGYELYLADIERTSFEDKQTHGDWTLPLVVTSDGVLLNTDLLDLSNDGAE